jgi:hypothetical protein
VVQRTGAGQFASIDYNAETESVGMNLNEKGIYDLYVELFSKGKG